VKKFSYVLDQLDALRGLGILVALRFNSCPIWCPLGSGVRHSQRQEWDRWAASDGQYLYECDDYRRAYRWTVQWVDYDS